MSLTTILVGLGLFQVKHFLADFVLQTSYQWRNKGRYGHPGGLLHAGIHAVGSIPALLSLGATESALAAVVAAEFVIHYHIDWSKERINSMFGLRNNSAPYWMVFGGDQLLHQLTYLAIVGVLLPH
jgi:hypothetical protein